MAFVSGGLTGRGIGNSTMKYNYLPEAHNDYILAIIGEELGFIGTVLFFALFCGLIWSAFKIAERASSNAHRLMAEGAALILILQFLVNALGIIGVTPMTGKTMPFISYGGSSLIASFMLAALVMRVSLESGRSARTESAETASPSCPRPMRSRATWGARAPARPAADPTAILRLRAAPGSPCWMGPPARRAPHRSARRSSACPGVVRTARGAAFPFGLRSRGPGRRPR